MGQIWPFPFGVNLLVKLQDNMLGCKRTFRLAFKSNKKTTQMRGFFIVLEIT
ncbi:protein of unknown function [Legionella micdadei]|uniref:Uncharacterized protein n=1 Tax=Legionella micdadei TaxID=451 RepID=A0A098GFV3_LEGMI|nr:protein of unknown function [Legionella micdadei]